MTLEEFATKLQEFRAIVTDQMTELEENPKWAGADERAEIIHELEELAVQVEALVEALEAEPEEGEGGDEE